MARQMYLNLPVKDLKKSLKFFSHLGFEFNPQFSNDDAACMIIGENIFTMLVVEKMFLTFTTKKICDAKTSTEVLLCITMDSRQQVDEIAQKAVDAGGKLVGEPKDMGFMYYKSFADLDDHVWEILHMAAPA